MSGELKDTYLDFIVGKSLRIETYPAMPHTPNVLPLLSGDYTVVDAEISVVHPEISSDITRNLYYLERITILGGIPSDRYTLHRSPPLPSVSGCGSPMAPCSERYYSLYTLYELIQWGYAKLHDLQYPAYGLYTSTMQEANVYLARITLDKSDEISDTVFLYMYLIINIHSTKCGMIDYVKHDIMDKLNPVDFKALLGERTPLLSDDERLSLETKPLIPSDLPTLHYYWDKFGNWTLSQGEWNPLSDTRQILDKQHITAHSLCPEQRLSDTPYYVIEAHGGKVGMGKSILIPPGYTFVHFTGVGQLSYIDMINTLVSDPDFIKSSCFSLEGGECVIPADVIASGNGLEEPCRGPLKMCRFCHVLRNHIKASPDKSLYRISIHRHNPKTPETNLMPNMIFNFRPTHPGVDSISKTGIYRLPNEDLAKWYSSNTSTIFPKRIRYWNSELFKRIGDLTLIKEQIREYIDLWENSLLDKRYTPSDKLYYYLYEKSNHYMESVFSYIKYKHQIREGGEKLFDIKKLIGDIENLIKSLDTDRGSIYLKPFTEIKTSLKSMETDIFNYLQHLGIISDLIEIIDWFERHGADKYHFRMGKLLYIDYVIRNLIAEWGIIMEELDISRKLLTQYKQNPLDPSLDRQMFVCFNQNPPNEIIFFQKLSFVSPIIDTFLKEYYCYILPEWKLDIHKLEFEKIYPIDHRGSRRTVKVSDVEGYLLKSDLVYIDKDSPVYPYSYWYNHELYKGSFIPNCMLPKSIDAASLDQPSLKESDIAVVDMPKIYEKTHQLVDLLPPNAPEGECLPRGVYFITACRGFSKETTPEIRRLLRQMSESRQLS